MEGVMRFLITSLLQIYQGILGRVRSPGQRPAAQVGSRVKNQTRYQLSIGCLVKSVSYLNDRAFFRYCVIRDRRITPSKELPPYRTILHHWIVFYQLSLYFLLTTLNAAFTLNTGSSYTTSPRTMTCLTRQVTVTLYYPTTQYRVYLHWGPGNPPPQPKGAPR